jgi:hypothetical protein
MLLTVEYISQKQPRQLLKSGVLKTQQRVNPRTNRSFWQEALNWHFLAILLVTRQIKDATVERTVERFSSTSIPRAYFDTEGSRKRRVNPITGEDPFAVGIDLPPE